MALDKSAREQEPTAARDCGESSLLSPRIGKDSACRLVLDAVGRTVNSPKTAGKDSASTAREEPGLSSSGSGRFCQED